MTQRWASARSLADETRAAGWPPLRPPPPPKFCFASPIRANSLHPTAARVGRRRFGPKCSGGELPAGAGGRPPPSPPAPDSVGGAQPGMGVGGKGAWLTLQSSQAKGTDVVASK